MGQVLSLTGSPDFFDLSFVLAACGDHETNSLDFDAFVYGYASVVAVLRSDWPAFGWAARYANPNG
jgi:hypothetical protein